MNPSVVERMINLAINIQEISAPTFQEHQRAKFIQQFFIENGLKDVVLDDIGNVYALFKGRGEKPPLVVSAHLDTVFPGDTNLTISRTPDKITGPGIGDNSVGLAGLFGLYWALSEADFGHHPKPVLAGDVWLVANVREEGLGNLTGMKAVVKRFGGDVLAYLILEGMSLGQIYHRGLGVRRYRISVHTKGGHSWVDYGNPSAIHELAELIVKIKNLDYPVEPRTSYNIGVITGGTSVNSIAADASIQLDLRSVDPMVLNELSHQLEELVAQSNRKGGEDIHVVLEVVGERPAGEMPPDNPLVKLALKCHRVYGLKARLNIGSTDANEPLSKGYPAICMGLTTGGGSHTTREYIDIKPIGKGLGILVDFVQAVFQGSINSLDP
jgi:acetylornithine deacetylase/succinyl-diaminopimelate desuccinylase-like protein